MSYIFFLNFLFYIAMGLYVLRLNSKSRLNRSFFFLCLIYAFWAFDNVLFHVLKDKENIWLYHKIFAFSWCFFIGIGLHFTLILTKRVKLLKKWWIYVIIYLPGIVFTCLEIITQFSVSDFVPSKFGWKAIYRLDSAWYWLYQFYYTFYTLFSVVLIWLWGKTSSILREKKQSRIIIICSFFGLISGYTFDSLLPQLNLRFLPPIGTLLILIWIFGIWYAIVKYRFMTVTPSIAADEIISRMMDLLFILNYEGIITSVNLRVIELLGYMEKELIGRPFKDIALETDEINNELNRILYFPDQKAVLKIRLKSFKKYSL